MIEINYSNSSGNSEPKYAHFKNSGFNLLADITNHSDIERNDAGEPILVIKPFERKLVSTGLRFELPTNFDLTVRSCSILSLNNGIIVLNTPRNDDSDVKVILCNISNESYVIKQGSIIAEAVFSTAINNDIILLKKIKNK